MKPIEVIYNQKRGLLEDLIKEIGIDEVRNLEILQYIVIDDIDGWELTDKGKELGNILYTKETPKEKIIDWIMKRVNPPFQ